ncbi:MAG: hypothetical protein HYR56_10665 [Acidobacteria bacterium]|nr:hypothetical protein [Acidobacteriota bacterium]MBI3424079.1 hypothetical protein [Acidobacteriota bacterium]
MNGNGFVGVFEQLRVLRLALSVMAPFVTMLTALTLVAFVGYLLGVCQLCRAERKAGK